MKKGWAIRLRLSLFTLLICVMAFSTAFSYAADDPNISVKDGPASYAAEKTASYFAGHKTYENTLLKGIKIDENKSSKSNGRRAATMPDVYDPRMTASVPAHIEDQGITNTCWAFSTIAASECNLIKNGYEDERINLSEDHLAYFFYNRQIDPLGGTIDDRNIACAGDWVSNGGTIQGTAAFLTTWAGVVKDSDPVQKVYVPEAPLGEDSYNTAYHVRDTYLYNYSVEAVKKAVWEHGAAVSGIYIDLSKYGDSDKGSYYCPINAGNHAVAIVGWDDNYPKENFKENCRPENDGAWIVRNSYGEGIVETDLDGSKYDLHDGYLYVSYEDASLEEIAAFELIPSKDDYDHNYQYDGTGNPLYFLEVDSSEKFANVFTAQGSDEGCDELLEAVSLETLSDNIMYKLEIYTALKKSGDPDDGKLALTQTEYVEDAGSRRITLDKDVTIPAGERYAVVFTLIAGNDNGKARIAADMSYDAGWIAFDARSDEGESYSMENSSDLNKQRWQDISEDNGEGVGTLRIKAYTNDTQQKTGGTTGDTKADPTDKEEADEADNTQIAEAGSKASGSQKSPATGDDRLWMIYVSVLLMLCALAVSAAARR